MPNKIDLSGQRFGRLVAMHAMPPKKKGGSTRWLCRCDCGNEVIIRGGGIKNGCSKSCGCLTKEAASNRFKTHGESNKNKSAEYRCWQHIKTRCTNKKSEHYMDYGGRGIAVCERWIKFENFLEDMGRRPSTSHSIDRIDNSKGYSKDNCKWSTKKEQSSNTRNNVIVNMDGKNMILKDACDLLGLQYNTVRARIKKLGWSTERALNLI